jgi:hypothetical protein
MKPRAAFVREYDWTFGSGQKVNRTFGIFNDTQYAEPITFTRTLMVGGKQVSIKTSTHNIAPGGEEKLLKPLHCRQRVLEPMANWLWR